MKACNSCKSTCTPANPNLIIGTNGILIVGESPKGQLSDGLISPTFKRLAKNLAEANIDLADCSFTEICKCELGDRKDLREVGRNCIPQLARQIEELKPKLVITLGVTANELFAEHYGIHVGVGNLVKLANFDYLPLWHTSPINPQGFRRNSEILKIQLPPAVILAYARICSGDR